MPSKSSSSTASAARPSGSPKAYYRATRASGKYSVHAGQTLGSFSKEPDKTDPIQFTVWEPCSLMGKHSSIGSRADYGDGRPGFVGDVTSRRIESRLPHGDQRWRFFDRCRARRLRAVLKIAQRAFPEFTIKIQHGYLIGR